MTIRHRTGGSIESMKRASDATRRSFLSRTLAAAAVAATGAVRGSRRHVAKANETSTGRPIPTVLVTDLFRPHNDPDDHWDLASVYALVRSGLIDLLGVLIDHPDPKRGNDPDVLAVAQMNQFVGAAVPIAVGSPRRFLSDSSRDVREEADPWGTRALITWLKDAPEPAVIHVLGSSRDVALAGQLAPDVFASKCRAVYLNAGSGSPAPAQAARLEWNVRLDPQAYSAMFRLPCPLYWMPCFHEVKQRPEELFRTGEFGTFYRFHQGDVLPHLSPRLQRYFAFMFRHGPLVPPSFRSLPASQWLQSLGRDAEPELMARINAMDRNMWCTGGFLHAAGQTVSIDGRIVPRHGEIGDQDPVFTFDPVRVTCSQEGVTQWTAAAERSNQFLYHVRAIERYPAAMTTALTTLLQRLP